MDKATLPSSSPVASLAQSVVCAVFGKRLGTVPGELRTIAMSEFDKKNLCLTER